MKNARFDNVKLRAFVSSKKEMIYPNETKAIFIGKSNMVLDLSKSVEEIVYSSGEDVTVMKFTGWRDVNLTDIYEGDLIFSTRSLKGGVIPIIGVVNSRDFSFAVNTGSGVFYFDYGDKNTVVVGNIFQNTDEELAAKTKELLEKFFPKKD